MKKLNKHQQQLVIENIEYAYQLAKMIGRDTLGERLSEQTITVEDLQQESVLGLCEAATRFDPTKGIEFCVLAQWWCRKYIYCAIRKYCTPVSVPDNFKGEYPGLMHFDLTDDIVIHAESVDDEREDDCLLYGMAMAEQREREEEEALDELVEIVLSSLTHNERRTIISTFGLDGHKLKGTEIAMMLGVAPPRVVQIKERALQKAEQHCRHYSLAI